MWRSFAGGCAQSLPRYLEHHAERIRSRYLAFVYELGERTIAGARVIDHLDRGDGFSLWWMSLLAEKSPLKSPAMYACLRLLALEELLREREPASVLLASSNGTLAEAVQQLCANLNIGFDWQPQSSARPHWTLRRVYERLPHALKGLLSLRHALGRWPLRAVRNPNWFAGPDAVFIGSYFIHLDPGAGAAGRFHSRQWEDLPAWLRGRAARLNWLHVFLSSSVVPDTATGVSWVRRFNAAAPEQGCHSFVESHLSASTLLSALRCWIWLGTVRRRLSEVAKHFQPSGSAVSLWPLLRHDWYCSLRGTAAMTNCLALVLFDAALASVPRQARGLYLYENQAWEKAFLHAWRKHGHGEVIGVQHATVPFWHLYYFEDPRTFGPRRTGALPLPDRLAVNGKAARDAFEKGHFPAEKLIDVEALRYLSLLEVPRPTLAWAGEVQVLVLGDLIPASMRHLLNLLEGALALGATRMQLTIKPHPAFDVDPADYPNLQAQATREPLSRILSQFQVAISANCTSAAVEAFISGLAVIIAVDGDDLNLSPLRGHPGVRFVSTPEELFTELAAVTGAPLIHEAQRDEFFFLSQGLPRWQRLLESAPHGA